MDEIHGAMDTLTKSRIIWNSKRKRHKDLYEALATLEHLQEVPELYAQGVAGIEEDYKRYLEAKQKLTGVDVEALRAERDEAYEKVASINDELRECRKELRLCEQIQADSPKIRQAMSEEVELEEREPMEEMERL